MSNLRLGKLKFGSIQDLVLLTFLFSLSFEYWDPFGLVGKISINKLLAILYFLIAIKSFKDNFSLLENKIYVITLLLTFFTISLSSYRNWVNGPISSIFNFTFIQNIVLVLMFSNRLKEDGELQNKALLAYAYGNALLGMLYLSGLGVNYIAGHRLTIFGDSPNAIGARAALGVIIFIHFALKEQIPVSLKLFYLILTGPLIRMIADTASRGAFLVLLLGIVLLIVFTKKKLLAKGLLVVFGSILTLLLIRYISTYEIMNQRMSGFVETGYIGSREYIWKVVWDLFKGNPFLGIGETGLKTQMTAVFGFNRSVHNQFLYVLITAGVIGSLFFIMFIYLLLRDSFKILKTTKNAVYLVLLIMTFFTMFKAGGALGDKSYFVVFSLVISADALRKNSSSDRSQYLRYLKSRVGISS